MISRLSGNKKKPHSFEPCDGGRRGLGMVRAEDGEPRFTAERFRMTERRRFRGLFA
jgi:hypothetical protein